MTTVSVWLSINDGLPTRIADWTGEPYRDAVAELLERTAAQWRALDHVTAEPPPHPATDPQP